MTGIPEISWFLDWAIKFGIGRDKAVRAAVAALSDALLETRIYLIERSDGDGRDKKREKDLARHWNRAANALRRVDDGTAKLALMKSEYWLHPEAWEDYKIGLDQIELSKVMPKLRELSGLPQVSLPLSRLKTHTFP